MPPVSQQGSRAGLISTLVVFSILFVTATILAFYFNAEMKRSRDDLQSYRARYADVITDTALSSPEVNDLKTLRNDPSSGMNPQMKVLDVVIEQRNQLAKALVGANTSPADAMKQTASKVADAAEKLKAAKAEVTLPPVNENLVNVVSVLADAVASKQAQIQSLQSAVKAAKDEVAAALAAKDKELGAKDDAVKDVREQTSKEVAAAASDRTAKQTQVDEIQKKIEEDRKAAQEILAKKEVELAGKVAELKKLQDTLDKTRARFTNIRLDVDGPSVRRAAGIITRVAANKIVFINRGQGDQLVPGMTFTVFDKNEGIPAFGDGLSNSNMPQGKASIEVIRVGAAASECRILKSRLGAILGEGDLIVNLIYDPNTKFNFVVFGKFDLDHNKQFTTLEAEVIKRLVSQWGGNVQDKINVDTDFVVMGKEPEVPNFSAEELQNPINKKALDDAKAELAAYTDVRQQARDLHIPIMNQNRFLYFVGYYDVAGR